jgi:hypothetical protein
MYEMANLSAVKLDELSFLSKIDGRHEHYW